MNAPSTGYDIDCFIYLGMKQHIDVFLYLPIAREPPGSCHFIHKQGEPRLMQPQAPNVFTATRIYMWKSWNSLCIFHAYYPVLWPATYMIFKESHWWRQHYLMMRTGSLEWVSCHMSPGGHLSHLCLLAGDVGVVLKYPQWPFTLNLVLVLTLQFNINFLLHVK